MLGFIIISMSPDLFSQFDPRLRSLFKVSVFGFWFFRLLLFIPINLPLYVESSRVKSFIGLLRFNIIRMCKVSKIKGMQGVRNYITALFFAILFINFSGMMP